LRLNDGSDPQELKRRTAEVEQRKRNTQPFALRSCGCIFRNPPGQSAGALIEKSGLKGTKLGGARVSIEHANFIVNEGGATSRDIEQLIERIRSHVKKLYSVDLEREVIMPGHRGGGRS
jgi:UDP-N-acetylmuramate dehydrogenase